MPGLLILLLSAALVLVALLTSMLVWQARRPPRRTAAYAVARGYPCDPGDLGLRFESWTLERPGARLPVWELAGHAAPAQMLDDRRPLTAVLVHGWGQSRIDMLVRLDPWRELVDRIVLYDLRGHGEADGGPSNLGWREDADLRALLDRLGDGRFVLVGHSMGAVIAIETAAAAGGAADVAGVVAYAPYTSFPRTLRARLRSRGLPEYPITDLAMAWFRLRGIRHPSLETVAAAVSCPLLLVRGEDDPITSPADVDALRQAIPHASVHEVPDAVHLDMHVVDAAGHADLVRRFVSDLQGLARGANQ